MAKDSDEDESNSDHTKTPSLTKTQREKLRGSADLGKSPGTFLDKKVRSERVERLPYRIHQLMEDISILSEVGFFSEEYTADIWNRVQTDDKKWQSWQWEPYLYEILYKPPRNTNKNTLKEGYNPRQFGIDIGLTIDRISGNHLSSDEMLEINLGILIGLQLGDQEKRFTDQQSQISQLQSVIESLEEKAKAWALTDSLFNRSAGKLRKNSLITYEIVTQATKDAGLSASGYLVNHIMEKCDLAPLDSVQSSTDQSNITNLREEYINKLEEQLVPDVDRLEEIDDTNPVDERKRELGEDMKVDIHQLDAIEPVNKYIIEIKHETKISDIENLIKIVEESFYQLNHLKSDIDQVFNTIYSSEKPVSSVDFSKYESGDAMHDAKILAGEKEYSHIWKDHPLVEGTSSSGWDTTAIGDLVGAIRQQNQYEASEVLHRFALDDETPVERRTVVDALEGINSQ